MDEGIQYHSQYVDIFAWLRVRNSLEQVYLYTVRLLSSWTQIGPTLLHDELIPAW
jgi:hypothetical protein